MMAALQHVWSAVGSDALVQAFWIGVASGDGREIEASSGAESCLGYVSMNG